MESGLNTEEHKDGRRLKVEIKKKKRMWKSQLKNYCSGSKRVLVEW